MQLPVERKVFRFLEDDGRRWRGGQQAVWRTVPRRARGFASDAALFSEGRRRQFHPGCRKPPVSAPAAGCSLQQALGPALGCEALRRCEDLRIYGGQGYRLDVRLCSAARERIVALAFGAQPEGLKLSRLFQQHCLTFNSPIDYRALGYPSLFALVVSAWPSVSIQKTSARRKTDPSLTQPEPGVEETEASGKARRPSGEVAGGAGDDADGEAEEEGLVLVYEQPLLKLEAHVFLHLLLMLLDSPEENDENCEAREPSRLTAEDSGVAFKTQSTEDGVEADLKAESKKEPNKHSKEELKQQQKEEPKQQSKEASKASACAAEEALKERPGNPQKGGAQRKGVSFATLPRLWQVRRHSRETQRRFFGEAARRRSNFSFKSLMRIWRFFSGDLPLSLRTPSISVPVRCPRPPCVFRRETGSCGGESGSRHYSESSASNEGPSSRVASALEREKTQRRSETTPSLGSHVGERLCFVSALRRFRWTPAFSFPSRVLCTFQLTYDGKQHRSFKRGLLCSSASLIPNKLSCRRRVKSGRQFPSPSPRDFCTRPPPLQQQTVLLQRRPHPWARRRRRGLLLLRAGD